MAPIRSPGLNHTLFRNPKQRHSELSEKRTIIDISNEMDGMHAPTMA